MEAGQKVGKYLLESRLGEGGMGEVWKARHEDSELSRTVAIKFIHSHVLMSEILVQRIRREAKLMSEFGHSHIVPLHDYWVTKDQKHVLVMPYYSGGSLDDVIQKSGTHGLDPAFILSISQNILGALASIHRKGRYHRDIKPANILLNEDQEAFLTDFGIAHAVEERGLTIQGKGPMGTVEYMSPEQIEEKNVDALSDIYSFGCVLYEMFTGRTPFGDVNTQQTSFEIMRRQVHEAPEPIQKWNPNVNKATANVIHAALNKDPEQRPGDCVIFLKLLTQALRPGDGSEGMSGVTSKRKALIKLVLPLAIIGILSAGIGVWLTQNSVMDRADHSANVVHTEVLRDATTCQRLGRAKDYLEQKIQVLSEVCGVNSVYSKEDCQIRRDKINDLRQKVEAEQESYAQYLLGYASKNIMPPERTYIKQIKSNLSAADLEREIPAYIDLSVKQVISFAASSASQKKNALTDECYALREALKQKTGKEQRHALF